jgi:hypothetical protein
MARMLARYQIRRGQRVAAGQGDSGFSPRMSGSSLVRRGGAGDHASA